MGPEADAEFKIVDFCDMVFARAKKVDHYFSNCTDFMAPELLENKICKESDIWSLGAILYFLLSGELPFANEEAAAQFYYIIEGDFSFCGEKWETISPGAIDLIKRMIVVEPSERLSLEDVLHHSWLTIQGPGYMSGSLIENALKTAKPGNKLQREIMRTVVKYLSPDTTRALTVRATQKAFKALDVERTGLLSVAAMKSALQHKGEEAESLNILLDEIKTAGGFVRYTDFLAAAFNCQKVLDANTLYLTFKRFDRDDDGLLTIEEVHSALANTGSSISIEEVKTLLLPFDQNADQLISFPEFKAIFNDNK
jgi:calcium-dependent protein kinase